MEKEYNLNILINQLRKKGRAANGYRTLNKFIKGGNSKALRRLLRNHLDKTITDEGEIKFRDNVDNLLDFYSLLFVAMIAGYIAESLPRNLKQEILTVLKNDFVKTYYTKYYPLVIPVVFLKFLELEQKLKITHPDKNKKENILFEKFYLLNDEVSSDGNVDDFLWFLDGGYIDNYDAADALNLLKDQNEIKNALSKENDDGTMKSVLIGFMKYLNFLKSYSDLLKQTNDYPYLFTVFYHFQGYWFFRLKKKFGNVIIKGLTNINYALNNFSKNDYNKRFAGKSLNMKFESNLMVSYEAWKEKSKQEIVEVEQSIQYLIFAQIRLSKLETAFTLTPPKKSYKLN